MNTNQGNSPLGGNSTSDISLLRHFPNPNAEAQQEGIQSTDEGGESYSVTLLNEVDRTMDTNTTVQYTVSPTREELDAVHHECSLRETIEMREAENESQNVNVRRVTFVENKKEMPDVLEMSETTNTTNTTTNNNNNNNNNNNTLGMRNSISAISSDFPSTSLSGVQVEERQQREEQELRTHAEDHMGDDVTMLDFLRDARDAFVPATVVSVVDDGVDLVSRSAQFITRNVPDPVKSAVTFTGHHIVQFASRTGDLVERAPDAVINVIPEAIMSKETKKLLFVDFSNVLRCFFHTNVLSIPYIFRTAGLIGGLVLITVVSLVSLYCTEAFFAAKNQLRDAAFRVVIYGDVPRLTWGVWYPSVNLFYGAVHLIGFLAFAGGNARVLLRQAEGPLPAFLPALLAAPIAVLRGNRGQRALGVLSSLLVTAGVILMLATLPRVSSKKDDNNNNNDNDNNNDNRIALGPATVLDMFTALGVAVYAFTGIGSAVPVERGMGTVRYIRLLRVAMLLAALVLVGFGLVGFITYGSHTCAVITKSLHKGPATTAVSALLAVASVTIIPLQLFPLAEVMDRRILGIRQGVQYKGYAPCVMRLATLAGCALVAYVVPYYGLILAIAGAFGCGIVGIIVPAMLDYVRRRRTALHEGRMLFWWEYVICFSMGIFGVFVVVVGVAFGMYNLWINIQTDSTGTC
ncbi:solute carrier family 36 (proton-coupled amino acid transporter) [Trypanosoma theileri]|uniref:Solute carrier family 36 (Proton-coupled amino acid transporter) n=1 Tax=Trypanosoma theileri TaxID=67003 RepID=A0A1X0NNS0_9TRYP|nr:solute carrier family 36 (proton-coupled amino acid transporter) [Trypanosoma theileri]ORC86345.1 solute carrier family 36 (proton-coupled amino acid transporter) [Trypanosoma theileri]